MEAALGKLLRLSILQEADFMITILERTVALCKCALCKFGSRGRHTDALERRAGKGGTQLCAAVIACAVVVVVDVVVVVMVVVLVVVVVVVVVVMVAAAVVMVLVVVAAAVLLVVGGFNARNLVTSQVFIFTSGTT